MASQKQDLQLQVAELAQPGAAKTQVVSSWCVVMQPDYINGWELLQAIRQKAKFYGLDDKIERQDAEIQKLA